MQDQARAETNIDESPAGQYDLVIMGGNAGGLSVAISSGRSGIERVRIVEPGGAVAFPELVPENKLDVGYGEHITKIDLDGDELIVTTNSHSYRTRGAMIAERERDPEWAAPIPVPDIDRVLIDELPDHLDETDVLIIGYSDHAVEMVAAAAAKGGRVVMAAAGLDPAKLSPAGENLLRRLERDRQATVLYRAMPDQIGVIADFPIAYFNDRRTPDLEFDYVVFASTRHRPQSLRECVSAEAIASRRVWFLGLPDADPTVPTAPGWEIGNEIAASVFPEIELPAGRSAITQRAAHSGAIEELRQEHYNATITHFEPTHSDLWVLRVKPDHGDTSHVPGQYASLGLGFWEQRVDEAQDPDLDERWAKLIRRSYSISHPIFDEYGYLDRQTGSDELEFYIVLVKPSDENVPALTPRLALKRPGDRVYLGPKVAGRYTLDALRNPRSTAVFLSTGTGEAPHNAMVVELLHKGHSGPIISAVTVRNWADLGYMDKHRELEDRYPNYHYFPMPTREADVPKRYLQNLITDGDFEERLGHPLDPSDTHVFLCGNPAMIGLPESEGDSDELHYPEPTGVVELLAERGFTLDKRGNPGNIHYEEYW